MLHLNGRPLPVCLLAGACFVFWNTPLQANAPQTVNMRTLRQVAVYGQPNRGKPPVARIHYDAVLEVEKTGERRGCQKGWGKLKSGGYVCLKRLKETQSPSAIAPEDNPEIDEGIQRYIVTKGGAHSFPNRRRFGQRQNGKFLYRGTVLAVKKIIVRGGTRYLITRDGQYIQGDNVEKMSPVWSLGAPVASRDAFTVAYIINDDVVSRKSPSDNGAVMKRWQRFDRVIGAQLLQSENGWVQLPDGGYMSDNDIARVREPEISFVPSLDEKWIAVDLAQQIVTAHQGPHRIYVALGSTGKKGNTEPGSYRVKWKRRLQTMNLYGGHLRVDDVSWVMYYIPKRGFALHTAWHRDFGHPVSHGCVNLPRDDARWFYEWAAPTSYPFESEDFHSEFEQGTRVIVF